MHLSCYCMMTYRCVKEILGSDWGRRTPASGSLGWFLWVSKSGTPMSEWRTTTCMLGRMVRSSGSETLRPARNGLRSPVRRCTVRQTPVTLVLSRYNSSRYRLSCSVLRMTPATLTRLPQQRRLVPSLICAGRSLARPIAGPNEKPATTQEKPALSKPGPSSDLVRHQRTRT